MIQIRQIEFGTPDYDEAVCLRYAVLRQPLGLEFTPEQLAAEYSDLHLAAFDSAGRLIGYLNLTPCDKTLVKMRQVAVDRMVQGRGVGRALVIASEVLAKHLGFRTVTLHARESTVPFYIKQAYQIVGDRFEEVTIPHFKMEKNLE